MRAILELRRELHEHIESSRGIIEAAEHEQRARTADEEKELRRLDTLMNQIEGDIGRAEREERLARPVGEPSVRPHVPPLEEPGRRAPAPSARWLDLKTGKEVRTLRPDERFADVVETPPEQRGLRVGHYLRGLLTGKWGG